MAIRRLTYITIGPLVGVVIVRSSSKSERLEEWFDLEFTKFYKDIHADLLYSHTGYERSHSSQKFCQKFLQKKTSIMPKMPPPTALGVISLEQFKRGSQKIIHLSGTISPTKMPDTTPLAASSWLQNAIK